MHKRYVFSNLIGTFVFNEHFNIIESVMFNNNVDYSNRLENEKGAAERFKGLVKPNETELKRILLNFKDKKFFDAFYDGNLKLTKEKIKASVTEDVLVIQAIKNIKELDKIINTLVKNLREWYAWHNPELSEKEIDHDKFVGIILSGKAQDSEMGAELSKKDIEPMKKIAEEIVSLTKLKESQDSYIKQLMMGFCPNLAEVAGHNTGAKLIELSGSLKNLVESPASKVQLLGAEEALFRHLKTGALCPKYGVIFAHDLIQRAKKGDQGRIARALADKISIAVKVDYFKGEFIGDKLRKALEERFR